ncbi:MAG: hypothetical protein ABIK07_08705, partial [Planctomycetota bacterium]
MRTNGFVGLIIAGICCLTIQPLYSQSDFAVEPSNESEGVFRISNATNDYEPAIDAVSFAPSSPRTSDLSPVAMPENYNHGEYYGPVEEYTQGDWIEDPYLEDSTYERLGIVAGAAAVFVKPGFDTDTAFFTEDQTG